MARTKLLVIAIASVALAFLALIVVTRRHHSTPRSPEGSGTLLAPDFTLKQLNGTPLRLSDYRGKVVLLDFWATWCAPCMAALPQVLDTVEHKKLSLLFVAINDKMDSVRSLRKKYGIQAPMAIAGAMSELAVGFGVTTNQWTGQLPSFVLIRPDGEVALIAIGCTPEDMDKTIDCMMSCRAPESSK